MTDIAAFLAAAADTSPNGMVCVDAERVIVATNRAFDDALGYARGALAGRSARVIYFGDNAFAAQSETHVRSDLASDGAIYTLTLRRHDGTPLPVDATTRAVREGEALKGWVSVLRDRRPGERRQAFLEDVIEACSDPIGIDDKIDRLLALGCRYFGLPVGVVSRIAGDTYTVAHARAPDDTIGRGDVIALADTSCEAVVAANAVRSHHRTPTGTHHPHPRFPATGPEAYIGTPLVSDGVRIGTLSFPSPTPRRVPFGMDDEALMMSLAGWIGKEMAIERTHARLRREREHYHRLYRRTPAMLLTLDARHRIMAASDRALSRLGRGVEEVLRAEPSSFMDAASAARAKTALRALTDGAPGGRVERVLVRFTTPDGEGLDAELSAVSEPGPNGAAIHVTLQHVGERERAMAELVTANEDLTRLNKGLKDFAYIASHDLQEPLRKITQFSSFLVEDHAEALEGEARYFVDTLSRSATRMGRLIEDLLAYSRVTNATLSLAPVALDDAIETVLRDLRPEDREAVRLTVPSPTPVLRTDARLLRRLLEGLIDNAIKFRRPGERPRVRVDVTRAADGIVITVGDRGVGFPPALAEAIFEPFRRLHPRDAYPGSGIGLALCRAACEVLGFTLTAASDGPHDPATSTSGGADFVLSVPTRVMLDPERPRAPHPPPAPVGGFACRQPSNTRLVLEASPLSRPRRAMRPSSC